MQFDPRSWTSQQRAVAVAGACAVMALGAWTARALHASRHVAVNTAAVTTGPILRRVIATGTLEPVTTVQVGAQVSGTIQSIAVDYNSFVHAGEIIARLDPALFQAAVEQAQAALQQARAAQEQAEANATGLGTALNDARTKLSRAEALGSTQLIPQSDLDAARIAMAQAVADQQAGASQVEQTRAGVRQATAALDQAKVNLDHSAIVSPIDGIVVARNVDVGQTIAASVQTPVLFEIAADLKRMQVEVDVDEADVGGIETAEPATFQVDAYPNETFTGTVASVRLQPVAQQTAAATPAGTPTPAATSGTSPAPATTATASSGASTSAAGTVATVISYAAMVDVANDAEKLRPGMTAIVTLNGSRRDGAVRIPNGALSFRPALDVLTAAGQTDDVLSAAVDPSDDPAARHVWKYDGAQFVPIAVRVGLADNQWTALVEGPLRPGDPLVTSASFTTGGP